MPALAVSVNDDKKLIDEAGAGRWMKKEYSKEVQQRSISKGDENVITV